MPYLKCEACRARVRRLAEGSSGLERCPLCDRPLEPVGDLIEVMGFRTITPEVGPSRADSNAGHQRIADAVGAVIAERRARSAVARIDAGRVKP